jgi:energy-coupling factor transporter ATP-binding protein EcfA2
MKLRELHLGEFKVLRELTIQFTLPIGSSSPVPLSHSPSYSLDFLIGINGTGKTTVLKALSDLIQKLENDFFIEYPFWLEYDLGEDKGGEDKGAEKQKRKILLSNVEEDPDNEEAIRVGQVQAWVDDRDEPEPFSSKEHLPDVVVAFTTGSEAGWESLEESQSPINSTLDGLQGLDAVERAVRELPGRPISPTNPTPLDEDERQYSSEDSRFLFIRSHQLPLVTLCGLLADLAEFPENRRLTQVMKEAKFGSEDGDRFLAGFSLKFRMPQGMTRPEERKKVLKLAKFSDRDRALRLGTDYLLVFDLTQSGQAIARQIIDEFSGGLELFRTLTRLATPDEYGQSVLREVNIFLERPSAVNHPEGESQAAPPLHLLEWLSDGERNFLGRMCLFTLLGATEALILLDEPEVHFNDFWKRQIVHLLDKTLAGRSSHVLITTHSSITLTDVFKEDIFILDRNGSYTKSAYPPTFSTFAADPSDIMIHIFRAPYAEGERSVSYIQGLLNSLDSPNGNLDETRQELNNLLPVVGQGYWRYRINQALDTTEQA